MTEIRLADLSPSTRKKIEAIAENQASAKPPSNKRKAHGPGLPLRCTTCGFVITPVSEGRLRKHQDENTSHGRYEYRP